MTAVVGGANQAFDRDEVLAWLKAHPAATDCRFEWDYSNPDEDTGTGA